MCSECHGAYQCSQCGDGEVLREQEPIGFKCDNCGEVKPLTLCDGWSMCDECIAIHEEQLQELITQIY